MNTSSRGKYAAILFSLAALLPVSLHAGTYRAIVAFGDSLTDTGNKYVATGLANTPPYDLLDAFRVPDGPYTRGGLHHSNGATWIEQLSRPLGLADSVRPALRTPGEATNYAYGGARARSGSPEPELVAQGCLEQNTNRHFPEQVSTFLADVNYSAPADALYVVFIGGNDIVDAVKTLPCDPTGLTSVQVIVGGALNALNENIITLYLAGARNFLVVNSPDLGLAPAFNPPLNIPQAAGYATCFSLLYNFGTLPGSPVPSACGFPPGIPGLVDVVAGLQSSPMLPGIGITAMDVYSRFVQLVTAPLDSDPQNGTDTCVMPNQPPYACKDPDNHVFWDGVHPTKETHSIIRAVAEAALAE
ncbi:MAG: SGNH/GDSL hydrolase family protein [Gammaproteobacteria bacterium]|jgi:outer membrane lipase/esterase